MMIHARLLGHAAVLLTLAIAATGAQTAWAQDKYPSKPITIVIGYPPGGSTDLTGRTLATKLGATVVVENLGGARGAIGAQKVANAASDGYTFLLGASNEIAINSHASRAQHP